VAHDGNNDDMIFDTNRPISDYDHYRGKIKIQHSNTTDNEAQEGNSRRIWVINMLPLEHYMWGYGEMSTGGVEEHAKAMIVAARSYARWYIEYATKWAEEGFNLLSTSSSQIYNGYDYEVTHSFIPEAARKTNGIIMKYDNEYALGAYCSNTDGNTRTLDGYPYLVSVPDPYGKIDNPSSGNHMWGMSANGSLVLARDYDYSYTGILSYYYTGISIVKDY
jgi:peptidoglycan hydrolase-like amidase